MCSLLVNISRCSVYLRSHVMKWKALVRPFASTSCRKKEDKLKWSYVSGVSEKPLLGVTVGQRLQTQAEQFPDRDAFVFTKTGVRKTFSELLTDVDKLAAGFLSLGLRPGDRVGVWGPNSAEWLTTLFAAARAGLILVTITSNLKAKQMEYILNKVKCKALVTSMSTAEVDFYNVLLELIPELTAAAPGHIKSRLLPNLETVIIPGPEKHQGTFSFCDVLNFGGSTERQDLFDLQRKIHFDDTAFIVFTSGTTGTPKATAISHHSIVNNSYFCSLRMDYHKHTVRNCICVPLHHSGGLNAGGIMIASHAVTAVFPPQPFTAEQILQAIQDEKCTSVSAVPTLFTDMLNYPELKNYDLTSLDRGLIGGSPIPSEIMRRVIQDMHLKYLAPVYGSTELGPFVFQSLLEDLDELRSSTVGTVQNHTEAKIIDRDGNVVKVGESGEVCIRGYSVFHEYWNDKEKTDTVLTKHRWFHTRDIGVLNEDGYLQIVGRMTDMIIRGGVNIYPKEIEELLYDHPKIHAAEIVGVPEDRLGEQVCAFIILKPSVTCTQREIQEYCKQRNANNKVPSVVFFVDSFPLDPLGKPKKRKLKEMAINMLKL